ncbi:MAG: LysR family transcriptional regulator [Leuconostoc sp.]|uniref:LysR family transcriptional regulator n=1 Tax=Leuconostoc sp. TaxID=1930076 RepID=UPI0039E8FAB4
MQINDLKYYTTLYHEKNFTKVAKNYGISQPSISSAIKRLETYFQAKLIIRGHAASDLHFTPAGEQLYQHAASILNELESAQQEITHLQSRTTTIGLPPILKNAYFAKIVLATKAFDRQYDIDHMQIYEAGSNGLTQSLINGDIDLALLGSLGQNTTDKLQVFPFATAPFYVYMSQENPLAKHREGIYFKDLKAQQFISFDASFIHVQATKQLAKNAGIRQKTFMKTNDVYFLMSLVAENLGVAILTNIVSPTHPDIVTIPLLDADQPLFSANVAFRKNHILTTEENLLIRILSQQA